MRDYICIVFAMLTLQSLFKIYQRTLQMYKLEYINIMFFLTIKGCDAASFAQAITMKHWAIPDNNDPHPIEDK